MSKSSGYQEIEHTADWELEIWAPDQASLLEQAARGMYALAKARLKDGPRRKRKVRISAGDPESLLVRFLSELLYFGEQEGLGFDEYLLALDENGLVAELGGAPLASIDKEIKAVTYHNLRIQKSERGLETRVVFDV